MKIFASFVPAAFHASLSLSICLILGIWWQSTSLSLWIFPIPLLIVLLINATYFKKPELFLHTAAAFFIGVGALWYHSKKTIVGFPLCSISFRATIKDKSLTGNPHWPFRTRVNAQKVQNPETNNLKSFSFFVYTKKNPSLQYDDLVECDAITIKQPGKGEFRNYLHKEGVVGTVFAKQFEPKLLRKRRFSFFGWLETKRENLFISLKKKIPYTTFAFFSSLFMGDKSRVKRVIEKQKNPFKQWGISHHLARSGLHLMLFVLLWHFLISFLPIPFTYKTILMTALSCIYFLLTPTTISFIRAFELFLLCKLCNFFNKQINTLHLICLVCSATLLYNPFQLFFLDFQLSFYLTFCLAWLSHLDRQKKFLA